MNCTVCQTPLKTQQNYWHRGACGHHQCLACALPAIRAGKGYCPTCPLPTRPTPLTIGNLVYGGDREQTLRVASELRAERAAQVSPLAPGAFISCRNLQPLNQFLLTPALSFSLRLSEESTPLAVGACGGGRGMCAGDRWCVHNYYAEMSPGAMQMACEFAPVDSSEPLAPIEWREHVHILVETAPHPGTLARGGMTAALLSYCGVSLDKLLLPAPQRAGVVTAPTRRYALEHLISAFGWTIDDLLLLGLKVIDFSAKNHFPMIVLYDMCAFRAPQLFAFEIGYNDLENFVLQTDQRYGALLRLNLPYWRAIL